MSIGAGGSSMSGSSSVATDTVFDMGSEQAVLALLRRIHLSPLPLDVKNALRDLVFSTRFGAVKPVDDAMIATFAAHGFSITASGPIAPVVDESNQVATVATASPEAAVLLGPTAVTFGRERQIPHFTAVPVPTAPPHEASMTAKLVISEPVSPTAPPSEVLTAEALLPVADAVPVAPPVAPAVSQEPVGPEVTDKETSPGATPTATLGAVPTLLNLSDRIAAIKREVNALVGNPVNLIDVNNDVGREYMNALLDAMKKSLGGTTVQEVERAMARLERSFVAVQETVRGAVGPAAPVAVETPPTHPEEAAPVAAAVSHVPLTPPAREVATSDILSPTPDMAGTLEAPSPSLPVTPVAEHEEPPQPVPITSSKRIPVVSAAVLAESHAEVITSVAKERQLKELMEARQAAEAADTAKRAAMAAHNPLMADDVTSGLHQLLSEWKLFKSSGIFGTGPSGNEHPLYKKLSQLTMAAVLAGRFEGANADIKRSITDYMNGWRYEEGVTHEVSETFEHYLRRVIRTILDKQTEKVDAR